jgi:hypothetical protein
MKLNFKAQEVAHAIEKKLKVKPRSKSEKVVWYELDGKKILRVTYIHGAGDMRKGTLNSIRNQLKLDLTQFKDFIDCPLRAEQYEAIIRGKGLV